MREPRRFLCVALGLLRLRGLAAQIRLCVRQLLLLLGHHLPRLLHLRLLVRRLLLGVRCALQGLLCLILLRARLGFLALLATPEHRAAKRKRDARHPNLVPHREASCVLPLPGRRCERKADRASSARAQLDAQASITSPSASRSRRGIRSASRGLCVTTMAAIPSR